MGPLLPGVVKVPFPSPWDKLAGESDDQFVDRMYKAFLQPFGNPLKPTCRPKKSRRS